MTEFTEKNRRRGEARESTFGALQARRVRRSLGGAFGREPIDSRKGIRRLATGEELGVWSERDTCSLSTSHRPRRQARPWSRASA